MSHHGSKAGRAKWLAKRKQDPFAVQARKEGFASRATYKLIAIQKKTEILRRGDLVLDIGSAPGGWSQYVAKILLCPVIAVDLNVMEPIAGVTSIQGDILSVSTQQRIHETIAQLRHIKKPKNTTTLDTPQSTSQPDTQANTQPNQDTAISPALTNTVDVVLCDACVTIRGIANIDAIAQSALTEDIVTLTPQMLNIGGSMVVKMFHGAEQETIHRAKALFEKVIHIKPPASRLESREVYLVAMGLREKR